MVSIRDPEPRFQVPGRLLVGAVCGALESGVVPLRLNVSDTPDVTLPPSVLEAGPARPARRGRYAVWG